MKTIKVTINTFKAS